MRSAQKIAQTISEVFNIQVSDELLNNVKEVKRRMTKKKEQPFEYDYYHNVVGGDFNIVKEVFKNVKA